MKWRRRAARLLYYPTRAWDCVVWRLLRGGNRWDRIDERVYLGGFPSAADAGRLAALGVAGVVNTCEEREGPLAAYQELAMVQLRTPIVDFMEPDVADIQRAVEFMETRIRAGQAVYVHCKSGRGRSPTIVLCWLIHSRHLTPEAAQQWLVERRPQVRRALFRRRCVQRFAEIESGPGRNTGTLPL